MDHILNSGHIRTTQHIQDTRPTFLTSPVDSPANITTTPSTRNTSVEDSTVDDREFRGVSSRSGWICAGSLLYGCVDSLPGPVIIPMIGLRNKSHSVNPWTEEKIC